MLLRRVVQFFVSYVLAARVGKGLAPYSSS